MPVSPTINPAPAPRETVFSYLSRLASTWGTTPQDFAYDVGTPFKRLLDEDPTAIFDLAASAGLTEEQAVELMSWTGVRAGDVRMKFRGEIFVSRALRNPVIRGCPICLREDAANRPENPLQAMVMRGDWQLRAVRLCIRHRHRLMPLWTRSPLRERFDFATRLQEILPSILSGELEQPRLAITEYDTWLDRRISGGQDHTWFRDETIFAVTTFCRDLGAAIGLSGTHTGNETGFDHPAVGFDAAVGGPDDLRRLLDRLANLAAGPLAEPKSAFGPLYSHLAIDYAGDVAFTIFRTLVRDCILENWPIAAGEEVLGEMVLARRFHSVTTAAKDVGMRPEVLETYLVDFELFSTDDPRPRNKKLFDAQVHSKTLEKISSLIGAREMRSFLGITREEMDALTAEGLLVPRNRNPKVKKHWLREDGEDMKFFQSEAVLVGDDDAGWEGLLAARKRSGVGLGALLHAARTGMLRVGRRARDVPGVLVSSADVDAMLTPEANSVGTGSGLIPLTSFAKSVGLIKSGHLSGLVEAGHTPARLVQMRKDGRHEYKFTPEDVAAFHQRFCTFSVLERETGVHYLSIKGFLLRNGIQPFEAGGRQFGSVYLRSDVDPVIDRLR
jgi:hypothetical protein